MKESEVVFAVAHIAPATPKEIAEFMDTDTSVSTTVTNVWRDNLLIRREREKSGKMGASPYEYALNGPE